MEAILTSPSSKRCHDHAHFANSSGAGCSAQRRWRNVESRAKSRRQVTVAGESSFHRNSRQLRTRVEHGIERACEPRAQQIRVAEASGGSSAHEVTSCGRERAFNESGISSASSSSLMCSDKQVSPLPSGYVMRYGLLAAMKAACEGVAIIGRAGHRVSRIVLSMAAPAGSCSDSPASPFASEALRRRD